MPKALPGPVTDPETHERVRHDRVDKAGSVTPRPNSRLHPPEHPKAPPEDPRYEQHPDLHSQVRVSPMS